LTDYTSTGDIEDPQENSAAVFRPVAGGLYLPATAMVLRTVDVPPLKPDLVDEYVLSRLSRWYPTGTADIVWELLNAGRKSCLVIVKRSLLALLRASLTTSGFVSINCGWRTVSDNFVRLVLTDKVCEAALFSDSQWTLLEPFACTGPEDVSAWLRSFSAASVPAILTPDTAAPAAEAPFSAASATAAADLEDEPKAKALELQLLLPPERKAEFSTYFKTGSRNVQVAASVHPGCSSITFTDMHVQAFTEALLPPRSGTRLFIPKSGSASRRYWLLAAGLAFIILNGSFLTLRFSADHAASRYLQALQEADLVLRENRNLDQELSRLEALLPEYRTGAAHPGMLLEHLADSGIRLTISSFTLDNNRFILRGATSNAIALTEYLRSISGFAKLSLSGVQLMDNGDEQFSLSGDYND